MRPVADKPIATLIQIELTNACNRTCSNCVRFCGHFRQDKIFYADLKDVADYLEAFRDFQGWVSYIGGEPTLHPNLRELCCLMREYRDRDHCGFFTNGLTPQFKENEGLLRETFGLLNINDHSKITAHTPVLAASEELVGDPVRRAKYFDDCWVQNTWSASITPKGAYFCEIAALLAWLYDGPDGWDPRDPAWWKRDMPDYADQIAWACSKCGAALPLHPRRSSETMDDVTPRQLERLIAAGSPKALAGKYEIYDKGLLPDCVKARDWYRYYFPEQERV